MLHERAQQDFPETKGTSKEYYQCVPMASSSLAQAAADDDIDSTSLDGQDADAFDRALSSKGGPSLYGTHEAKCDPKADNMEQNVHWCLSPCKDGFVEKGGRSCEQKCTGKYEAEGYGGICGVNSAELTIAATEMVAIIANGALKAVTLIDQMKKDGVEAETLSETINTFIDMGKPFARPTCPE